MAGNPETGNTGPSQDVTTGMTGESIELSKSVSNVQGVDMMTKKIGFIGLGHMGRPMANTLIAQGFVLNVYNRTPEKAAALVTKGAGLVDRPSQAVEPGGVAITMLSDDAALESVVSGDPDFVERLRPDGIHLSMSSISPALARRLADHHRKRQVRYVAAPVFGRPEAAEARKLWICVSGEREPKERVAPVLNSLGQGVFDFGEDPGASNVVKLIGNFLLASAMEALAEGFALGEKEGIDRVAVAELFTKTLFNSPAYRIYSELIAYRKFEPAGFRVSLGLKDIRLVLDTAKMANMPMPLANLLRDRLLATLDKGWGNLDWSGIALDVAAEAGLATAPFQARPHADL